MKPTRPPRKTGRCFRHVAGLFLLVANILPLLALPASADCHNAPPAEQVWCLQQNADAAANKAADRYTSTATTTIAGWTNCGDGRTRWDDWTAELDTTCDVHSHYLESLHSIAAQSGTPAPTRILLGTIWINTGLPDNECYPTPGVDPDCRNRVVYLTQSRDRAVARAVSHLNTGAEQTIVMRGPFTYC